MNRSKPILALAALILATLLFLAAPGCTTSVRASFGATPVKLTDESHTFIDVPEFGFLFEADKWWTLKRFRRAHEVSPVLLYNQVYAAQVLLTVRSSVGESLFESAREERQRLLVHHEDTSAIISAHNEIAQWSSFYYHVGPEDRRLQEFILFAKAEGLPEYTFVFYGTWEGEYEDDLEEQVIEMASTIRVMPPWMIELRQRR